MGMHTIAGSDARDLVQLRHDLRQYVAAGVLLTRLPGDELLDEGTRQRLEQLRSLFLGMQELTSSPTVPTGAGWELDLVALVDECVSFVRLTHKMPFDLRTDVPATAYGDPVLLRRAVTNVLDNATRAAGESGRIKVRVDTLLGQALVEIADDGAGFGQIPTDSGEGLSIVDKALRACHGRLEISSGPGPGTTVRMLIPAQRGAGGAR